MLSASKSGGASGASGYNLTRSLRFRASASANLSQTITTSATWALSVWVKRGVLSSISPIFGDGVKFLANDTLTAGSLTTTAVYRDPSSWYHVYVSNLGLYINGALIGAVTTSALTNPKIASNGTNYFDGELAEFNFINGATPAVTAFGSFDSLTGVWKPARYTGSYPSGSSYLPFTDNSALTTSSNVGLGKDFSGNGNYWVTNNISLTAGVTYDSMTDVPTLTSATAANFAVLNPLTGTSGTVSNGNLYYYGAGSYMSRSGTMVLPPSTKIYYEATVVVAPFTPRATSSGYNFIGIGLATNFATAVSPNGNNVNGVMLGDNGYINNFTTSLTDTGTAIALNNVIGVAIDTGANTYTFYVNNTSVATGTIGVTAGTALVPFIISYDNSYGAMQVNFGQRPFSYTPPTGFVSLNTYNLPTSTILAGNKVMDATLYTGTLLSNAITNAASFKPDLVWVKSRSAATDHKWTDSVRGVTKALVSNSNAAETTDTQGLTAFNTNGFTVGTDTNYNNLSATYVAWQWQAGQGSTSSNTNGTITSTVSVNASAGFSVVTWTANASANQSIGHGLGVAPKFVIVKDRTTSNNWNVWFTGFTADEYLQLNTTAAKGSFSTLWYQVPTSSVFYVGTSGTAANYQNGDGYVAYCWTPIAGYSAFGSYTGNGSSDGTFVYTGFRSRFMMTKRTDTTGNWVIHDTARNTYNVADLALYPNLSAAEDSGASGRPFDILSNGFKARATEIDINASGGTYIYACFSENPFKNALAR